MVRGKPTYAFVLIFTLSIFALAQTDAATISKGKLGAALDEVMTKAMAEGFSGAVLIAKNGEVLLRKGYGQANREKQIPVTSKTVFDIGSVSKVFTVAAILTLEQQGKLTVADTLGKFFSAVPADKSAITLHQLLTHTSGLLEYHDTEGDFEAMTRDEAVRRIFAQKLLAEPGKQFAYSNSGMTLLAAIVEIVSGKSFPTYLREKLLDPAGMRQTGFYRHPLWSEADVAHGYNANRFGTENSPLVWPQISWALMGNGGMVSSPADLYLWLRVLKSEKILSEKSKQKMFAQQFSLGDKRAVGYGVGSAITERGTRVLSHAGANEFGFFAFWVYYPDEDAAILISSNSGRAVNVGELQKQLARLLFTAPGASPKS